LKQIYFTLHDNEKGRIKAGVFVAVYFVALLWIVKILEAATGYKLLYEYGILPRSVDSLYGIITAPFIHSGYIHLFNNSVPLFIAILGIFYFYPRAAARVLIFIYLVTNLLVWFFGRPSYHIGASGLVYGYIAFLFFGSAFSRNKNMLVVSLIIMFIYGAMFWGIFPQQGNMSWESHLFGSCAGLVFAFVFRNYVIAHEEPELEDEEEDESADDDGSDRNEAREGNSFLYDTLMPEEKEGNQ
jgi:membrane associated rhomboid family serine protease